MNVHPLIKVELNEEQQAAVIEMKNCVVVAGAGAGKTRVLAYRFAHLIIEHGFTVDSILTLTFTKKATAEMYGRIHSTLKEISNHKETTELQKQRAITAIENFHSARIQTLDSYCSSIVRYSSRHYGIKPDFIIDNAKVKDYCIKLSLEFLLKYRKNTSLQDLLGLEKFENLCETLFVTPIMNFSNIAYKIDFFSHVENQIQTVLQEWANALDIVTSLRDTIVDANEGVREIYNKIESNIIDSIALRKYFDLMLENKKTFSDRITYVNDIKTSVVPLLSSIHTISKLNKTLKANRIIKAELNSIKEAYSILTSIIQYVLYFPQTLEILPILQEYQDKVIDWKRQSGALTYSDVSALARKILIENPEIRKNEKTKIQAIMIDEFQDNNLSQKEMLFMLAEKIDRNEKEVPKPEELCANKLFFVGDEKQSIYKFRGADVSVFRQLKKELGCSLSLSTNYRSHPQLIASFNTIFGGYEYNGASSAFYNTTTQNEQIGSSSVFLHDYQLADNVQFPDFEAEYAQVFAYEDKVITEKSNFDSKRIHICLLDNSKTRSEPTEDSMANATSTESIENEEGLVEAENIAIFTAEKIAELCSKGCNPKDIAILFRSYSKQYLYEKHLRRLGIPHVAENITNFFGDAPVNDILALIRLIVYPKDVFSLSVVLRSPFVKLTQQELLSCLLQVDNKDILLCSDLANNLEHESKKRCENFILRYNALREKAHSASCAQLIQELWYIDGYRYETMWNEDVALFSEFYDFLFDIARKMDLEGKNISYFVDYLHNLENDGDKLEDMNIPLERKGAVQLMSIHKSKGLEFKVVFVASVSSRGRNSTNIDKIFFDKNYGPSLNFPTPSSIENCEKNYFYKKSLIIEKQMSEAELRRVLYVAMTRAENELYITGSYTVNSDLQTVLNKEEIANGKSEKELFTILSTIFDYKVKKQNEKNTSQVSYNYCIQNDTLFAFLLPIIAQYDGLSSPFSLEVIEKKTRDELQLADHLRKKVSLKDVQAKISTFMHEAMIIKTPTLESPYRSPSQLLDSKDFEVSRIDNIDNGENPIKELDVIIKSKSEDKFNYSHFGTIAHLYAESLFTKLLPIIPPKIMQELNDKELQTVCKIAEDMALNFSHSNIGNQALSSKWHRCEYNFMLLIKNKHEKKIFINGQIDLVFESGDGKLIIVDYKTDSVEVPEHHVIQLAAYRRAVSKIFSRDKDDIICLLYYLRTGNYVDVTKETEKVDLEKLIFTT